MFPLLLTILTPSLIAAPALQAKQPPVRVGQIFIVGNHITLRSTILDRLSLFPGQILSDRERATATRRLSGLRIFGIRAKWSLVDHDSDSSYKDIRITVEETWLTWILLGPRSAMDDLLPQVSSGVSGVVTYCFGRDHAISTIVHTSCDLFEAVYNVAPASTLSTLCAKSPLLAIGVHLSIGIPESLSVLAPVLGAPSK
jgi:hypothetical protein